MTNVRIDPLSNLRLRKMAVEKCILALEQWPEDPRQPDALRHYNMQLATIEEKIKALRKEQQGEKPPPIVIKLKTADLSGTYPKGIE